MADLPKILFLRPFWDSGVTIVQLKALARSVRGIASLVALQNGSEASAIRVRGDPNPWARFGTLAARAYEIVDPPLDVSFVASTDDDWQRDAIQQITDADAIILHLAPGDLSSDMTAGIEPGRWIETDFGYRRNLVREAGVGHGVLRELHYCSQASALSRTIVLIPEAFQLRLAEVLPTLFHIKPGMEVYLLLHGRGSLPMHMQMSAMDQSLVHLPNVHAILPYKRFGDGAFMLQLRLQLLSYFSSSRRTAAAPTSSFLSGIPSGPICLPPDGELKWIRFTRLEKLTKIPPMQIVELSLEEVRQCNPAAAESLTPCKRCGRGSEVMFFFQRGLTANLEPGAGVLVDCQYCGYRNFCC